MTSAEYEMGAELEMGYSSRVWHWGIAQLVGYWSSMHKAWGLILSTHTLDVDYRFTPVTSEDRRTRNSRSPSSAQGVRGQLGLQETLFENKQKWVYLLNDQKDKAIVLRNGKPFVK